MTAPMETEAKFLLARRRTLERIAGLRRLGTYRLVPGSDRRLRTIYVDTPERALLDAKAAFRIRTGGGRSEATVKLPGEVRRGVHRRPEWNFPLAKRPSFPYRPSPSIERRLPVGVRGSVFVPLLETRTRRRVLLAHESERKRPVAEICLDEVEFVVPAPRGKRRSSRRELEVEIELRDGAERDLSRLVDALRAGHPLVPTSRTKLERGLRWAGIRPRRRRRSVFARAKK